MVDVANYTLPVYKAVVCGLTLTKLREEESWHKSGEVLSTSIELEERLRTAIDAFQQGDFSRVSTADAAGIATALSTLVSTLQSTEELRHHALKLVPEPYRPALFDVSKKIEAASERLEEIAEGWCMAINETSISEIREAIKSATRSDEVTPWRDVLASVKD